jgi:hypothetical protein
VFFFSRVKADINNHVRGPGFFTVVAGTCVLGSALLMSSINSVRPVTVRENKPTIDAGLNGGWLLAVVATQSISVLGALLVSRVNDYHEPILFFTLCMFLIGCMLYLPLISLIFYRFTFVT